MGKAKAIVGAVHAHVPVLRGQGGEAWARQVALDAVPPRPVDAGRRGGGHSPPLGLPRGAGFSRPRPTRARFRTPAGPIADTGTHVVTAGPRRGIRSSDRVTSLSLRRCAFSYERGGRSTGKPDRSRG